MSASQARTARQTTGDKRRTRHAAGPAPLVLGRYRLHQRLGAGAFGTVWMASDERLERDVAVKILPRERVVGGRFEREARVAARLAHPGIVTLYEAAVDDEGAYLVSELVRGSTLNELLESGLLSDRDIVAIGIALCDALEHAHAEGVIHRDVKPSNVLVPQRPATPAQLAKLTDFGVARVIGGDSLTHTGDVIGTLDYMAPEQAEGLPAGAAADLYSLALVLYEALTGINPVRVSTVAQRARRLGTHLPPLRRQRRDLPRELGQGIDLALRPRPRERGTVSHLRRALVAAREQVGDESGVVAAPWASREERCNQAGGEQLGFGTSDPEAPASTAPEAPASPLAWPARALAALGAAATAAWLSAVLLATAPLPPAAAALAAGGLTLVLPRVGWLALTAAACATTIAQGRPGFALLALLALLVPVLFTVRTPQAWPLPAGAPALGLIGLAGAWPALAARAPTAWRRAALGAAGWIWLLIAAPIAGRVLYLKPVPASSPMDAWAGSPYETVHRVLVPLLSSGALAPAAVWALAAAVLPWLVLGRSRALDCVRVVIWSAALAAATAAAITVVHGSDLIATAPAAVLGAAAGAVVALAPSWLPVERRLWQQRHPGHPKRDSSGSGGQFP
ncbi:MAG: protein kinase domain-containing protein [Solirubrobacteraceae bacterium]